MTRLSVNLNKIALLRNSRGSDYPSVLDFAQAAIDAGAEGLTVHPRPDQRHIQVTDVYSISQFINTDTLRDKGIEFNIEGNPFAEANDGNASNEPYPGLLTLIEKTRPHQATLVPDSDSQLTSDHGFDLKKEGNRVADIIGKLKEWNVRSSLFMDPDQEQIALAKTIGADCIELYTGPYAENFETDDGENTFTQYLEAAKFAHKIGLKINAGHDLNLRNLSHFLTIPHIEEVSIGHALTVDALLIGYKSAVKAYSQICRQT